MSAGMAMLLCWIVPTGSIIGTWLFLIVNIGIVCPTLSALCGIVMHRSAIRAALRGELRDRGISVCKHCAYDIRGSLRGARCPECGEVV
jgi:hypothetical protein